MTEEQIMQLHQEITDIIAEYIIFQKKKKLKNEKKKKYAKYKSLFYGF